MNTNLFSIITSINLFGVLILAVYFLFNIKGNKLANKIIALLLFVFSFQIFYSFAVSFWAYEQFMPYHKILYTIYQTAFLIGPFIYIYLQVIIGKSERFSMKKFYHFIPFVSIVSFLFLYFSTHYNFIIWESKPYLYIVLGISVHNLIYLILSIRYFRRSGGKIRTFLSKLKESSNIAGIQFFLISFILLWIVNLHILAVFMITGNTSWCAYTSSIWGLTIFIIMTSFMLIVLYKPNIYIYSKKYKYLNLSKRSKIIYLEKLRQYINLEKPYLEFEIKMKDVANELEISEKILSHLINETYRMNFRNYINQHRLKDSIRKLSDPQNNHKTVSEIMYSSGFNSKTVFFCLFKEYTGCTPTQYRKYILSQVLYQ